jgi:hypothetical protein
MYITGQPGNENGKSCAHSGEQYRLLLYWKDRRAVAKLIPSKPIDFNQSEGEVRVFEALSTLPDSWYVFHSLRWLSAPGPAAHRAIPTGIGESDFLLFNPERGVVVVEVKSGRIRVEQRQWFQRNRNDHVEREIEDPEKQASRSVFFLKDHLNERLTPPDICKIFHVVWFPSFVFPANNLPPNYAHEMLLDVEALGDPLPRIEAAFDYWERIYGRSHISRVAQQKIVDCLAPTVSAVVSFRSTFEAREREFIRLTTEQATVLDFLDEQRIATIGGAAGTGKTVLAIEKARRLSDRGDRVLFLCFNAALRKFLQSHHPLPRVAFHTFHSLAAKHVAQREQRLDVLPGLFLQLLAEDRVNWEYDHVIIDEAQDFESEWLEWLQLKTPNHFYAFFDRNQCVQRERFPHWLEVADCRLTLSQNCRNTLHIARTAYRSIDFPLAKTARMVSGKSTLLYCCETVEAGQRFAKGIVKTSFATGVFQPHDIAVLTMKTMDASALSKLQKLAGADLAEEMTPGHVCFTSVRRFKGLEAKVVIMADVEVGEFYQREYRNRFYVGSSRAMHELHILISGCTELNFRNAMEGLAPERKLRNTARSFAEFLNAKWVKEAEHAQIVRGR